MRSLRLPFLIIIAREELWKVSGMVHDVNGSFAHPQLPIEHHLSKQVLYRIKNS
ncbi:hypothetical protein [Legionella cincinnatiensis]|uniref:hypothetical protein n=1 Tax=Legionella cincinnatiensis TaxID=28085 RepID=UPI001EE77D3B|nr:hypothetical protein [Legionella cincinnatiensis]